jgi:3-deoxy-D-manno-octulosonic-acid transferase
MSEFLAGSALALYRGSGWLFAPFAGVLLDARSRRGKEDSARRGERLGHASYPRPSGPLIWVHAASVGETMSVLPLVTRLTRDGSSVLLTTGTVTSAAMAATRLPPGAIHQFVPLDLTPFVRRFLDHWRPDVALFVESEIWPTTLSELDRRHVPRGLVNARLSERSMRRWQMAPRLAHAIFAGFALVAAQSDADAARLQALGVIDPAVTGNIKFDGAPLATDATAESQLRAQIGTRPIFTAASTHPGEEAIVAEAAAHLHVRLADLLTIIVPRHPVRGAEIAAALRAAGHHVAVRSAGETIQPETRIYLADTLGELGLFYRLAAVSLVGGSLVPIGGHNPIEAAQLRTAILHGPHVANARDIFNRFDADAAALVVSDAAGLAEAVATLFEDAARRTEMIARAQALVASARGALDRTQDLIVARLLQAAPTAPARKPQA